MRQFVALIFILLCSNLQAYESEDKLKVVIIGKVAKYVTWQDSDGDVFKITVLNNPFGDLIDKRYSDKKINKKPVEIKYIDSIDDISTPHILYIHDVSSAQLEQILQKVSGKNILTISDSRGFADKKGIVQIYFASQKVKLKINHGVSKKENLMISSALLRIAEVVK